jgi:hypothetical protein
MQLWDMGRQGCFLVVSSEGRIRARRRGREDMSFSTVELIGTNSEMREIPDMGWDENTDSSMTL